MITNNSNEINELPVNEVLMTENIGDLQLEMVRLPSGDVLFEATCSGELLKISRLKDVSDFQAGRVFQDEYTAYSKILKS